MYHTSPRRKLAPFNRDCGGLVASELAPVPFFDFYPRISAICRLPQKEQTKLPLW